jgi:hypothetical protein
MIEKQIQMLIFIGTSIRYLQDANENSSVRGTPTGWGVVENIKDFLKNLDELGLTVTSRASATRKLTGLVVELEDTKADFKLIVPRIRDAMNELRPTLEAETRGMIAYILSERRYRIDHLIKNPDRLFASGVYAKLPELSRRDFSEAGKCLAFERPTAAAFHLLRAIEGTLRHYYCMKVRRKRTTLMWGPMIHSMRSMSKRFPKALLNQLDHIRDSFRNPTAHPEKIFDIDETQDLLAICIDAANRMVQDLG